MKNRGQTEPRESKRKQTERRTTMHGKARLCDRARKVAQPAARPCCACGRAVLHGRASSEFRDITLVFRLFLGIPSVGVSKRASLGFLSPTPKPHQGEINYELGQIRVDLWFKYVHWIQDSSNNIQVLSSLFYFSFTSFFLLQFCSSSYYV